PAAGAARRAQPHARHLFASRPGEPAGALHPDRQPAGVGAGPYRLVPGVLVPAGRTRRETVAAFPRRRVVQLEHGPARFALAPRLSAARAPFRVYGDDAGGHAHGAGAQRAAAALLFRAVAAA